MQKLRIPSIEFRRRIVTVRALSSSLNRGVEGKVIVHAEVLHDDGRR